MRLIGGASTLRKGKGPHRSSSPFPPGWQGRTGWRKALRARGPVGFLLQSLRTYGLAVVDTEEGPVVQQKGELPLLLAAGPVGPVLRVLLGMLQRARRIWLQDTKPDLVGLLQWDPDLSREQVRALDEKGRPLWRLLQSGQYHTAERAARLGLVDDDTCFICHRAKQTWVHLWSNCPGLDAARQGFGPSRPRTPAGKDLRSLCGKALAHPEWLPPAMAHHGVAMELGADLTRHRWATTAAPCDREFGGVEAGAWPPEMHPELAALIPFSGATARQAVEAALGPTLKFPDLSRPRCAGVPGWDPGVFLDGSMTSAGRWAPWSRLAGFAVWSPGRTPDEGPRTQHEEDFLEFRWEPEGLLQWAVVQGRWQTSARAEDMAALAGLLGPGPVALASDNSSTVGFLQRLARGEELDRRGRRANGDVRAAISSLASHRGLQAAHITKVKAHTSEEQAERGLVTTEWLRLHNGKADEAAREATQQHPALLRKFIDVMAGRGKLYIRFLQELAKLYVRVARAVEQAYGTVVGATEAPLPPSLAVGGWPGPRW